MSVVGVDACKGGWVAVELLDDERVVAHFLPVIAAVGRLAPSAEVIAIDIPIGLPVTGRRAADEAARAVLGARRSSAFFTPPQAALLAPTHAEGSQLCRDATGHGMSQQAYGLGAKILEVDAWLADAPCPVVEIHPEVTFTELLGHPAFGSKKSWLGMVERYRALAAVGIYLETLEGDAPRIAATDDVLDAGAAAWSARRIRFGEAYTLPASPPIEAGRPVAIWV